MRKMKKLAAIAVLASSLMLACIVDGSIGSAAVSRPEGQAIPQVQPQPQSIIPDGSYKIDIDSGNITKITYAPAANGKGPGPVVIYDQKNGMPTSKGWNWRGIIKLIIAILDAIVNNTTQP